MKDWLKYMFRFGGETIVLIMCTIIGAALYHYVGHPISDMAVPAWLPILIWSIPVFVYFERALGYGDSK